MPGSIHIRHLPNIYCYAVARNHFYDSEVQREARTGYWRRNNDPEICVPLSTRYFPHYSLCRRIINLDDAAKVVYSLKLYNTHLLAYVEPDEEGYELRVINRSWTTMTTNAFISQMGWGERVLSSKGPFCRISTQGSQFKIPFAYRELNIFSYTYADAMLVFNKQGRCELDRSFYKSTPIPVLRNGLGRIARALLPYMHAAYVRNDYEQPGEFDESPKSMRLSFFNKVKKLLASRKADPKLLLNSFETEAFFDRARHALRLEKAWEFNNNNLEEKLLLTAEHAIQSIYGDVALKNDFALHLPPSMMWGE
jgi:hypothetical protein